MINLITKYRPTYELFYRKCNLKQFGNFVALIFYS